MIFQKMKLENLVKLQQDKDYLSTVIKIHHIGILINEFQRCLSISTLMSISIREHLENVVGFRGVVRTPSNIMKPFAKIVKG